MKNCKIIRNDWVPDYYSGSVFLHIEPIKEYIPEKRTIFKELQKDYPELSLKEIEEIIKNNPEYGWQDLQ